MPRGQTKTGVPEGAPGPGILQVKTEKANNLFETDGAGGLGAILGAIVSFFGLKGRINYTEKRINAVTEKVVFKDSCIATHKAVEQRLDDQSDMMKEMHADIKHILIEVKK